MSAAPGAPAVLYAKTGAVAEVVLNRPERLNAYDVAMRDALHEVLTAIRDDSEVRSVVLRGNGPAFSTGGDLGEFGTAPSPTAARAIRWKRDVWGALWGLPQITIAAVHGPVIGGGFEMMLLCDQAIASRDAVLGLPETGLGMIPGVAGTQTLPRLLGRGRALDLVLTGRRIDARRARELGLVQRLCERRSLRRRAIAAAVAIAEIPPPLARAVKRLINQAGDYALASGLRRERTIETS